MSRLTAKRQAQQAAKNKDAVPFDVPKRSALEIMADPKTKTGAMIARTAKQNDLDPAMLAHAVQHVMEMAVARDGDREAAKEYARKLTGLTAADVRSMEERGFDYSSRSDRIGGAMADKMKKFDIHAEQVNSQYPGVIGRGEEHAGAEKESHSAELWDLIKEGKQAAPSLRDPEIMKQAVNLGAQWKEQLGRESHQAHEDLGEF